MRWHDIIIDELRRKPVCGYQPGASPATEPTSLSAIALATSEHLEAANQATQWLASLQADDGSLGIRQGEPTPCWPTSLAVLAWITVDAVRYAKQITAAIHWTLSVQGERIEPTADIGHNTQLIAWPWIEGTHSWIEPTALHVRALKAAGYNEHARTREAIELLVDRQLPSGGCNYGNTEVLGQALLPHVQPTGLAMLALSGESDERGRINRSLAYLKQSLSARTTTASLCWGLLGLSAHGRRPAAADWWLESAYGRTTRRDQAPYKLALLALAASSSKGIL
ncbi:MAG: hypothetical protein O3C40_20460 [Planctomycetota bacterium]|nr:hypothetical protein [Planctomycetota bacterium]